MKVDDVKVSIVLPCFNGEKTVKETLNSVANQSYKNFEIIFVDDGSTDRSLNIVRDFKRNSSVKIKIISRENRGFITSLNEAIHESKGVYIARIDADDKWCRDHLQLVMNKFSSDESFVLIGTNAMLVNSKDRIIGHTKLQCNHNQIIRKMMSDNPFIHSSVVFKRFYYYKTPGYGASCDEKANHIADYNLWFEFSKLGLCEIIPNITLEYKVLDNSMSRSIDFLENYLARLSVATKNYAYYRKHHLYYCYSVIKIMFAIALKKIRNQVK